MVERVEVTRAPDGSYYAPDTDIVRDDDLATLVEEQEIFEYFQARAEGGQCIREEAGLDSDGNRVIEYFVPILPEDIEKFPVALKNSDTYLIRDHEGQYAEGSIHCLFKEGYDEVAP